jgi:molybdopterin converting factor small subunit
MPITKVIDMQVTVKFFGPIAEQAGQERVTFSFAEGATYGQLLEEVGKRFGRQLPERIWDSGRKMFKAGILAVGEGRDLHRPEALLRDGEEIKIIPLLGGG